MNPQTLDARLRVIEDALLQITPQIESLEMSRASQADALHQMRARIAQLEHMQSDATKQFELIADVLEKLTRDSIAHGVSADQRESHTIKAFAVVRSMLDDLRRTLGAINKSSAANASLSNDMYEARDDIKEIRELLDQHVTRMVRVEKLAADLREAFNVAIGDIPTKPEPEFIRYTHADDLRAVIRECIADIKTEFDASEPTAWMFDRRYGSGLSFTRPDDYKNEDGETVTPKPLYKHPSPLSKSDAVEIRKIVKEYLGTAKIIVDYVGNGFDHEDF